MRNNPQQQQQQEQEQEQEQQQQRQRQQPYKPHWNNMRNKPPQQPNEE